MAAEKGPLFEQRRTADISNMRALKSLLLLLVAAGIFLPAADAWPRRHKKPDYRYKVPKLKYKKPKIKGHKVHH